MKYDFVPMEFHLKTERLDSKIVGGIRRSLDEAACWRARSAHPDS